VQSGDFWICVSAVTDGAQLRVSGNSNGPSRQAIALRSVLRGLGIKIEINCWTAGASFPGSGASVHLTLSMWMMRRHCIFSLRARQQPTPSSVRDGSAEGSRLRIAWKFSSDLEVFSEQGRKPRRNLVRKNVRERKVQASAPSYLVTARVYLNFSIMALIMATGLGAPTPVTLSQPLVSVRVLSRPKISNKVVSCSSGES
jgi:hypothetical protein